MNTLTSVQERFRERFPNGLYKLVPIGGKFIGGARQERATEEILAFIEGIWVEAYEQGLSDAKDL